MAQGIQLSEFLIHRLRVIADFLEASESFGKIEGYLHPLEGYTLMKLAAEGPGSGAIVEIGSFCGKSTCWLARGAKSVYREKVTTIDHFMGSPEHQAGEMCECQVLKKEGSLFPRFMENIRQMKVDDYVKPVVSSSEEAAKNWTGHIRLLFIDGDHSYEQSRKDFELWSPFVVMGGLIGFHDVNVWPGVTQFYKELMGSGQGYLEIMGVNTLKVVQKVTAPDGR